MKSLIVLAHPEQQSFNGHLARLARKTHAQRGHEVQLFDLYESGFDPCEAGRHYEVRHNPDRFDAQTEQRWNWQRGSPPPDVRKAVEDIFWADQLILQFPLWWFGPPAVVKGWIDRVFVYGGIYSGTRRHDTGVCRGKRALLSVTTGCSEAACSHNGREGDTRLLLWPMLYALRYVGYEVLQPFIIHGVRGGLSGAEAAAQDQYLSRRCRDYEKVLQNLDDAPRVPFNSDADWDASGKLKSDAPVYSPFIRLTEGAT
jgi:NAD(P)H dehydrogenase (quinone)